MKRIPRKVFVSGSSYIVSLPKEWVVRNSIDAGDTIYMNVGSNVITISPITEMRKKREVTIVGEKSPDMITKEIISYYLAGYTTIRIKTDGKNRNGIDSAVKILIGAEILEDLGEEVLIEIFIDEERFNVIDLLEKMVNTVYSMMDDFRLCLNEFEPKRLEVIEQREQEVDRLYFFILRLLKSAIEFTDVAERLGLYPRMILGCRIVLKSVERVADHLFVMGENLKSFRRSVPEIYEYSGMSFSTFRTAMNSFFKLDIEMIRDVFGMMESIKPPELNEKYSLSDILYLRKILDGIDRIFGYSEDIAEIALNLSI